PSDCVVFYSWPDVLAYDGFLDDISDPALRNETRTRTVDLFRLLERSGCRHQALVAHFDETIGPCGDACDACLGLSLEDVAPQVRAKRSTRNITPSWMAGDTDLFNRLRVLRRSIA